MNYLINNPNYYILEKDMKVINNKMVQRGYGSQNLRKFSEAVLNDRSKWNKCR